jgi:uncharacterized protein (DUF697 family)
MLPGMSLGPGRLSSEYWKSLRAEVLGALSLVAGVLVALLSQTMERGLVGVGIAAVGGFLLAKSTEAYAAARGGVKAAAVRRPADNAPRQL